jgi:MFS family permease
MLPTRSIALSTLPGWIFIRFNPKWVLVIATALNVVANTGFCFSMVLEMALMLRILTGMSQAFMVIYAPVWVDEFAPEGLCTVWMSLMQVRMRCFCSGVVRV